MWGAVGRLWAVWGVWAAVAVHRDHDFHFIDDKAQLQDPSLDFQDPFSSLCSSVRCPPPQRCAVSTGLRPTARCVDPNQISHNEKHRARDDEIYYEWSENDISRDVNSDNCVECPSSPASWVCGSDGVSYRSLCHLDLRNCRDSNNPPVTVHSHGPCRKKGVSCWSVSWRSRLLDWFSAVMAREGGTAPPTQGFPSDCLPEVRWMFTHLDSDGDGQLSQDNLYALRHDSHEACLRPFISRCARRTRTTTRSISRGIFDGISDGTTRGISPSPAISRAAWCSCLRGALRPCTALARAHPTGPYTPSCDAEGFFLPLQCSGARCWCVTSHGAAVGPAGGRGELRCGGGEGGDDEDGEGSGGGTPTE